MKNYTLKNLVKNESVISNSNHMTEKRMQSFVREKSEVINEEKGYIYFTYQSMKMALLSDEEHDRMRIISPITSYSNLAPKIKDDLMYSNFHKALDARYAVSEDTLYAVFIHPLSTLTQEDLESALKQVANLKSSFGKTYSSGQLDFTNKK
jgi:hypothetical protein